MTDSDRRGSARRGATAGSGRRPADPNAAAPPDAPTSASEPNHAQDTAPARDLAVVDVDGVVADVRHRLRFLRKTPGDWDGFFAAANVDPPLDDGVALVRELHKTHDVVWLTGRPERSRGITTSWLAEHGLPTDEVLMRPDADRRPGRLFKRAELRRLARSRRIVIVIDDDPEVVALLRSDGWPVELADWMPYEDVLGRAQEAEGRT